jgi:hypothetical protein
MSHFVINDLNAIRHLGPKYGLTPTDHAMLLAIANWEGSDSHKLIRAGKVKDIKIAPLMGVDGQIMPDRDKAGLFRDRRIQESEIIMQSRTNVGTFGWTAGARLAYESGVPLPTFKRRVAELEEQGWVLKIRRIHLSEDRSYRRVNPDRLRELVAEAPEAMKSWLANRDETSKARRSALALNADYASFEVEFADDEPEADVRTEAVYAGNLLTDDADDYLIADDADLQAQQTDYLIHA